MTIKIPRLKKLIKTNTGAILLTISDAIPEDWKTDQTFYVELVNVRRLDIDTIQITIRRVPI